MAKDVLLQINQEFIHELDFFSIGLFKIQIIIEKIQLLQLIKLKDIKKRNSNIKIENAFK